MAQAVEKLSSKYEALSSNPSTTKKKKNTGEIPKLFLYDNMSVL
jgi:hypothetical protein